MMSITTLSRQGGRLYRQTGLGMGLVSLLVAVGGIAPPVPPSPAPVVPPVVGPVVPGASPTASGVSPGQAIGGGGWARGWGWEHTPLTRRGAMRGRAPAGRVAGVGHVGPASHVGFVVGRVRLHASVTHLHATGYVRNLARDDVHARQLLEDDEDEDAQLTEPGVD